MKGRKLPYTREELFQLGPQPTYMGRNLDQIAFPLGGIGAGSVSLGGWGQLRDFEVMNRPAKGFAPPRTFFTIKVHEGRKAPITRVLQGPAGGDFIGGGRSAPVDTAAGLPHFRHVRFRGEFPLAFVELRDPATPVRVTLEAFNPFIPLNDRDSSLPVAILLYHLQNTSNRRLSAAVFGNLTNVIGHPDPEGRVNRVRRGRALSGVHMTTTAHQEEPHRCGSMALATVPGAKAWRNWRDARLNKFWEAVAEADVFPPPAGAEPTATVTASVTIEPGGRATLPFFIAWHFPVVRHWGHRKCEESGCASTWRNYYASQWANAWEVAGYAAAHLDRLHAETKRFHNALFRSTLPAHVLDAVSSQLSTLKTTTCLRLEDGTFYGFEGCNDRAGCCEGSCTHVWNYAQALPYLFPGLQRSMLEAHFQNSMSEDGYIQFRMPLPLGRRAYAGFVPAADGQMGLVMQVYREWLISGDRDWLRRTWPQAKRALEFAWKYWDADRDGVMEGVQHNTYDIEYWGPNPMMGGLYLGALRAAEEMARAAGDPDSADAYRVLFRRGSAWIDDRLWNNDYYEQKVNSAAAAIWPRRYRDQYLARGRDDCFRSWPKWQVGKGCLSDQLIGQWYAAMLDLGTLFDRRKVRKALRSIFRNNWRADLSEHPGLERLYALNDEAGLIVCTWPRGGRPGYPSRYADEVWCGIEYQVASHLICEDFVEEGLTIVKGVRDRHRGDRRNPWDEFECGHHYARSMASYALLLALSGFRYSAPDETIGFAPRVSEKDFRTFFCVASGWGTYHQKVRGRCSEVCLRVDQGELVVRRIATPLAGRRGARVRATVGRKALDARLERDAVVLGKPATLREGQTLRVLLT